MEKLGRIVLRKGEIDRSRVANLVFRDRELLAWLEGLLHPRVSAEYLRWRDEQDAALTVTEVPLLFEAGSAANFDAVVVVTAPEGERRARSRGRDGRPRGAAHPRRGEGRPRRLRVRQRRVARRPRRLRGRRRGAARRPMTRLGALLLVVAIGVGVGAAIVATEPTWYLRMRYPLRYADIVRGHAENYRLEPELLAAVIYTESKFDRRRGVAVRCDRADAAPPRDGGGDRASGRAARASRRPTCTTRSSTSATGRGTSGTCWTSTTATSARRSRPTTAARGTSTAASSTPRRRRTSTASASSRRHTRGPTATSSARRPRDPT